MKLRSFPLLLILGFVWLASQPIYGLIAQSQSFSSFSRSLASLEVEDQALSLPSSFPASRGFFLFPGTDSEAIHLLDRELIPLLDHQEQEMETFIQAFQDEWSEEAFVLLQYADSLLLNRPWFQELLKQSGFPMLVPLHFPVSDSLAAIKGRYDVGRKEKEDETTKSKQLWHREGSLLMGNRGNRQILKHWKEKTGKLESAIENLHVGQVWLVKNVDQLLPFSNFTLLTLEQDKGQYALPQWMVDRLKDYHPNWEESQGDLLVKLWYIGKGQSLPKIDHKEEKQHLALVADWEVFRALLNDADRATVFSSILFLPGSVLSQDIAAQILMGGRSSSVKKWDINGLEFFTEATPKNRLGYASPYSQGMHAGRLRFGVRQQMQDAIKAKATPGSQVLLARHAMVVLEQCYGTHTFADTLQVKKDHLYDLASVTKISSTLPLIMQAQGEGKVNINKPWALYLPELRRSNKSDMLLKDVLTHHAGLYPWIPFWRSTLRKNGSFRWRTFQADSSARFPLKVTDELYLHRKYENRVVKAIRKSKVSEKGKYVYSDLGFIMMPFLIKEVYKQALPKVLQDSIARPLGMHHFTFNPLDRFKPEQIVPTEFDLPYRKVLIHGKVHDEGASMIQGVSGHAGLFANASDLAKLMQMYLNKGSYGGYQFIKKEIMEEFASYQNYGDVVRRGIGFDKPVVGRPGLSAAASASGESFGHSGFTGTYTWVDPKTDLLFVFLGNRVYPTRDNRRLIQMNTRTQINQVGYEAILE